MYYSALYKSIFINMFLVRNNVDFEDWRAKLQKIHMSECISCKMMCHVQVNMWQVKAL